MTWPEWLFNVNLYFCKGTDPNSSFHISSGITVTDGPVSDSILQGISLILSGTRISAALLLEGLLMVNIGHSVCDDSPRLTSSPSGTSLSELLAWLASNLIIDFFFFLNLLFWVCWKQTVYQCFFCGHFGLMWPFFLQVWHSESLWKHLSGWYFVYHTENTSGAQLSALCYHQNLGNFLIGQLHSYCNIYILLQS